MKKFKTETQLMKMNSKELVKYRQELKSYYLLLREHLFEFLKVRKFLIAELKHKADNLQELIDKLEKNRINFDPEASSIELDEYFKEMNIH